jgi:hypothetical protein
MKKHLGYCIVLLLFMGSTLSFGQNAYKKGDRVVTAGIGLGGVGGVYGSTTLPAINVGYEVGFEDKISLGGLAGIAGTSDDLGGGWKFNYTYIIIGARGAYHFLENNEKMDAYAGIMLGYNIVSASVTKPSGYSGPDLWSASGSYLEWGGFIGGRYYFTPQIAGFAELGYGIGLLNLGITYKLD